MTSRRITKKQLLRAIDELERHPRDRARILGDIGITATGAVLGWAASASAASMAGATAVTGLAAKIASAFGLTVVIATPASWVIGSTIAGGALAYGLSRLVRGGGIAEGRKRELLHSYRQQLSEALARERAGTISNADRTRFYVSLRDAIRYDLISPETATEVISRVESGHLPISRAIALLTDLIKSDGTVSTPSG